jgi:hypothetical protein
VKDIVEAEGDLRSNMEIVIIEKQPRLKIRSAF